jgi:hypothetical protein
MAQAQAPKNNVTNGGEMERAAHFLLHGKSTPKSNESKSRTIGGGLGASPTHLALHGTSTPSSNASTGGKTERAGHFALHGTSTPDCNASNSGVWGGQGISHCMVQAHAHQRTMCQIVERQG